MDGGDRKKTERRVNSLVKKIRNKGFFVRTFIDWSEDSLRSSVYINHFREYHGDIPGLVEFLEGKSKEEVPDSTEDPIEKWITASQRTK